MNLALGALIIVLLLLPALFFRIGISISRLHHGDRNDFHTELVRRNLVSIFSKLNFSEILFFFSIIPILLHLVSLLVLRYFWHINIKLLLDILTSNSKGWGTTKNDELSIDVIQFLTYVSIQSLFSACLGWVFAFLVVKYAGRILTLLIGDNIWYQLFTGMLLEEAKRASVDVILVDIVTSLKEGSLIYSGVLKKFDIVRESGQLSYITIEDARCRDLRKESVTVSKLETINYGGSGRTHTNTVVSNKFDIDEGEVKKISPGKYFTLQGKDILNVNVTYYNIVFAKDPITNQMVPSSMVPV
ncbi:hypothetical protein LXM25_04450 [Dyadobacter sp. LJ53]|uniref:hypothetical protein n=1 Tax=Dyadobacter chenwenxiniae TaxID=2906456 RepID=UPI001F1E3211|nr:hypothetical protein [Dyadobacter chenwenxiniae]MCF0049296.1 hypothetical protein [Dyadobacter chenwenxiniae]